jgi:hypothetical protein
MASFAPTGPEVVNMIQTGVLKTHADKANLTPKSYTGKLIKIRTALGKKTGVDSMAASNDADVRAAFEKWLLQEARQTSASSKTEKNPVKSVMAAEGKQKGDRKSAKTERKHALQQWLKSQVKQRAKKMFQNENAELMKKMHELKRDFDARVRLSEGLAWENADLRRQVCNLTHENRSLMNIIQDSDTD